MAFEVSEEAVAVMRELAKQLPNTVEEIQKANVEVLNCYESVRDTVGPHARKIENIVRDVEKQIRKSFADICGVSERLTKMANRTQMILDKNNFKSNLQIGFTPRVSSTASNDSSTGNNATPNIGEQVRELGHETQLGME